METNKTIVYLYNRLLDPVIQSNLMLYINDIGKNSQGRDEFVIITYEDHKYPISAEKKEELTKELTLLNITWKPFKWHQGTQLWKKILDMSQALLVVFRLRIKGYKHIISLGTISGSFAYLYSKMFCMKLYLYQYEPHSEYGLDSGIWSANSFSFKIQQYLDKQSAMSAKVISSGTKHMMERLANWNAKATVFKIPSVTNHKKFCYREKYRITIRTKYNIPLNAKVILYSGKFGGLYYYEETAFMFRHLLDNDPMLKILIVTQNPKVEIEQMMTSAQIPTNSYIITSSTFDTINQYLSAADFGIIAVPPGPSRKFMSNIKVGEYLCSGLPYLIPRGISEDDWYAEKYQVGVVVHDFSKEEIYNAFPKIKLLLNEKQMAVKKRCREVGIDYRGFSNLNSTFKQAYSTLIS